MTGREHAIVIGGSLAGLCAASALARHFRRVTVLERDALPDDARLRAGAPQARHVHVLLVRGRRELEALFPGFERRLLDAGAVELDFGMSFAVLRPHGWQQRKPFDITGLFQSRALLESVVRELARQIPNLELRDGTDVLGLIGDGQHTRRVLGVRVQGRSGGSEAEALTADLVVDASGRSSKIGDWLAALGLAMPAEIVVDSDSAYATRWYQAPPADRLPAGWWWKGIWIDPELPDGRVAGVLSPVEGDRWIVTLGGMEGHYPPTDEDGFVDFLGRLRSPLLFDAVKQATPLTPVYGHRAMANRFRHFESWRERLDGFVALGDAVCAFNPVYGQGMTAAAVSARLLGDWVAAAGPGGALEPRRYFKAQARFLTEVWTLATGADFRFPKTTGPRPPFASVANGYLDLLILAAEDDLVVRDAMRDVVHLIDSPTAIFRPRVIGHVLAHAARRRLGAAPAEPAPVIAALPPT
jgi:2-polyprenyl-6-methoxyphenol hydroxylase-like FAD-dependent oxidoreductase